MSWADLPDLVLEKLYSMLPLRQRYYCSQVCRNWNNGFYSPGIWRNLVFDRGSFVYPHFSPFRGYWFEVSAYRLHICLKNIGEFVHNIDIKSNPDFHAVGQYLHSVGIFLSYYDELSMPALRSFSYTFNCELWDAHGQTILGTGGTLLAALNVILDSLQECSTVRIRELLLRGADAIGFLDQMSKNLNDTLRYLELINITKERYPIFYVGMISNLRKLVITPQNINGDIVLMLARHPHFEELVIVQDKFTTIEIESIDPLQWMDVKNVNPNLRVRLQLERRIDSEVLIQENAPVYAVIYDTPYHWITPGAIMDIVDFYPNHLRIYGHLGLPKKFGPKSFTDRADTYLVMLVRHCPKLQTLFVRERVSTATLLVIASEAPSLQNLHVRANAVLTRCDWPVASHWTEAFYIWLKGSSKSFELVEKEISRILKKDWHLLSDKEYKQLSI